MMKKKWIYNLKTLTKISLFFIFIVRFLKTKNIFYSSISIILLLLVYIIVIITITRQRYTTKYKYAHVKNKKQIIKSLITTSKTIFHL